MKLKLHELAIGINSPLITPTSPNFSPPSWPPPRDWPVVVDKNGAVVSCWGDSTWDLSPWAGTPAKLNFGDGKLGKAEPLDAENSDLMRMVATLFIWGPRASASVSTVLVNFSMVRQVVAFCSRNNISAAKLMRYPNVLERVPEVIAPSKFDKTIAILHRLHDARELLGFTIVNPAGLKRLVMSAPENDVVQTPYIPPRIWLYQVERLRECLTDFLTHREQIEACFRFCLDSYSKNFGSLEAALAPGKNSGKGPFKSNCDRWPGCEYQGKFSETAVRFGIVEPICKWVNWDQEKLQIKAFSAYLSVVSFAALAYVANFTLQRKEEVAALRTSCLLWELDEKLGRVPIICGETTKTDRDSDARWVASPSVEVAIQAASAIAHLRMMCDSVNPLIRPSAEDQNDPYLWSTSSEPWGAAVGHATSYDIRQPLTDLGKWSDRFPRLFNKEALKITSEDLAIALRLTPNLPEDEFAVDKIWPLNWHQFRRTGGVNMFASGVVSDSTMQYQMKHSARLMSLYYGRNFTRLRLNKEVETAVVMAMYEAQVEVVKQAAGGDRFVSPHAPERKEAFVVNVLSAKDTKALIAMAKKGTISFREHRLGGCMKAGVCEYGGVESVARCAGGDGGKPCTDVLYDRMKEPQVRADMRRTLEEINRLPIGHPRYNALVAERLAMENYLNAIQVR